MTMRNEKKTAHRVSVGFTDKEWTDLRQALSLQYHLLHKHDMLTARERSRFIRLAVWAVAQSLIRQQHGFWPLACDARCETGAETATRLGPPASACPDQPGPKPGDAGYEEWKTQTFGQASPWSISWLKKRFPGRY